MAHESKTDLFRKGLLTIGGICPVSNPWKNLLARLTRAAGDDDITVFLSGETGVGKTMLAQGIHNASPRAKGPFVHFDASTEEPTVMRGTLFGHEKSAYTGADAKSDGIFHAAKGGTLFIDEVTDLSWDLQGALRHAVDYQQVRRLGGTKMEGVEVRIICATNVPLEQIKKEESRFRRDLFMRLRQAVFQVPPLRTVPEEIPAIVTEVVEEWRIARGKAAVRVSDEALSTLVDYPWPGNVRELKLAVRTALVECRDGVLRESDLRLDPIEPGMPIDPRTMEERTHEWAIQVWQACGENVKEASRILDIHPNTMRKHVQQYEVAHPTTGPAVSADRLAS